MLTFFLLKSSLHLKHKTITNPRQCLHVRTISNLGQCLPVRTISNPRQCLYVRTISNLGQCLRVRTFFFEYQFCHVRCYMDIKVYMVKCSLQGNIPFRPFLNPNLFLKADTANSVVMTVQT